MNIFRHSFILLFLIILVFSSNNYLYAIPSSRQVNGDLLESGDYNDPWKIHASEIDGWTRTFASGMTYTDEFGDIEEAGIYEHIVNVNYRDRTGFINDKVEIRSDQGFFSYGGYVTVEQHVPQYFGEPENNTSSYLEQASNRMGWVFTQDANFGKYGGQGYTSGTTGYSTFYTASGAFFYTIHVQSEGFWGRSGWWNGYFKNTMKGGYKISPRVALFTDKKFKGKESQYSVTSNEYVEVVSEVHLDQSYSSMVVGKNTLLWLYDWKNQKGDKMSIQGPAVHFNLSSRWNNDISSLMLVRYSPDVY